MKLHVYLSLEIDILKTLVIRFSNNNNNNNSIYLNTIKNSAKADVVVYGQ